MAGALLQSSANVDKLYQESGVNEKGVISVPGNDFHQRKPTIEDYVYYAELQQAADREEDGAQKPTIAEKLRSLNVGQLAADADAKHLRRPDDQIEGLTQIEIDKIHAWRALRQTTWLNAFFLCTSDIIGPFNAPYAVRQNGYVPGTLLYVFMGGLAFYCGALLWWLYVRLDSTRFPVKSYSDITDRIAGWPLRIVVTWLVFIHMIVNVAHTSLSAAQSLYQLSHGHICFVVAIIVWIIVGCLLNQIQTLKRYSWLCTVTVFLVILIIFLSVGFIAHTEPNYAAAKASYGIKPGPVKHTAFTSYPLYQQVNGAMNIVYAYGGATIFPQIIAEMRRPMDFLKAFSITQAIIFCLYVFYGLFVYSFQGQFTLGVGFQGISKYSYQTVCNVLYLISIVIAGGLYGNVGLKIFYVNVIEKFLRGPQLVTVRGRLCWTILVLAFWWTAFVIAAAIPQVQTLSGMVGAATNTHFTYSFPTGFTFLYLVQLDATVGDGVYRPGQPLSRVDSWHNWSRWRRGLFGPNDATHHRNLWWQLFKWVNCILSLAAIATAGLGMYGSGLTIRATFKSSAATSFSCHAPV